MILNKEAIYELRKNLIRQKLSIVKTEIFRNVCLIESYSKDEYIKYIGSRDLERSLEVLRHLLGEKKRLEEDFELLDTIYKEGLIG